MPCRARTPGFCAGPPSPNKVVGKAAAALMIVAGVSELHADVISRPALDLLAGSGVKVGYAEEVPHVINRSGTGLVPAGDPLPRFAYPGGMRGADTRFYECDE